MSAGKIENFVISADDNFGNLCSTISEHVKDDKVCVVAVVGRQSSSQYFSKSTIIHQLVARQLPNGCGHPIGGAQSDRIQSHIEAYYSQTEKTLYLSMNTVHDAAVLINQCEKLSAEISENGVYKFWQTEELQHARAFLYLFHLSHIIVMLEPGSSFDMSYVRFFRTIDNIRVKLQPQLTELLQSLPISKDWVLSGRPCAPRVLFAFTHAASMASSCDTNVQKKMQNSIEDQIYRILRKSRVITNISNNSLFAIPYNEQFVHVFTKKNEADYPINNYLNMLREQCSQTTGSDSPKSHSKWAPPVGKGSHQSEYSSFITNHALSDFTQFLSHHIQLALSKGFDDNVGRSHVKPVFEVPSLQTWLKVAESLKPVFFNDTSDKPNIHAHFNTLSSLLDIDSRFSDNRCSKVLPMAESAYQESLPKHYTTSYHKRRLAKAEKIFKQHARGPAMSKYYKRLEDFCEKSWKNGHQLCEQVSLTGRHCVHELHNLSDSVVLSTSDQLPIKAHSSQVKTKAACNCGKTQTDRDDPFTHKEANYEFYCGLGKKCCGNLECVKFPIFKSSIAGATSGDVSKTSKHDTTKTDLTVGVSGLSLALSLVQSGAGASDLYLHGDQGRLTPADQSVTSTQEDNADVHQQTKERVVSPERQHSTTEYLSGMVNADSPSGLLPRFSSWSLCSLGKSTIYVPSQGLDQPGFLSGSNFLLPWDVTVKCDREKWPSVGESSGKKGKFRKGQKDSHELNLRIYVGLDYECIRGHRFFLSAPDKMVKSVGSQLKDTAAKILSSDMPLYYPCTCRSGGSKTSLAQLMRIYVSIPDGPVNILLNPRIQPAASNCPIYFPEEPGPITLSSGSLWVLRLPYVYMGEEGPLLPPVEPQQLSACRLLKGVLNISSD